MIKEAIEEAKNLNKEYNFLNLVIEQKLEPEIKKGKLSGYTISAKDAINIKGIETTAGSAILNDYKPFFDATVIERVKKEGGIIIGKASQDAFGFGGLNINVGKGKKIPSNPLDKERCCGGSSGGSAGFTAKTKFKHLALGESTGGSIVCPASFCGVVGLCPTYGRVPRYGLIDYGNSLDKIGPITKNVYDAALLLEVIAGYEDRESTSADVKIDKYTEFAGKDVKGMKVGIITDMFQEKMNPDIKKNVLEKIKILKKKGVNVEEVYMPFTAKYGLATYYITALAEASTNLARLCGMRYGAMEEPKGKSFNEYFSEIRDKNFNDETKRRIIIGTFARMVGFRNAYYIKAAKIRTKIIEEYKELFKRYDALICPTMPNIAPKFSEIEKMSVFDMYMMDYISVGPNLAGLPHISIPSGKVEGMPIGTMLIGDHLEEKKIIQLGSAIEDEE
jgi:aspartyl-tRNA(Asn)/glutamyl-tRNA(Gln) amidotransferase subunit A